MRKREESTEMKSINKTELGRGEICVQIPHTLGMVGILAKMLISAQKGHLKNKLQLLSKKTRKTDET